MKTVDYIENGEVKKLGGLFRTCLGLVLIVKHSNQSLRHEVGH